MILKLEKTLLIEVELLTLHNLRNEGKMEAFQTPFPNPLSKPPPKIGSFSSKS